jgi:hypothetical protein
MSWRTGAKLFREIWPLVLKHEPKGEFRSQFASDLLDLFLGCDVDPSDIRGIHPEVDRALARIEDGPQVLDTDEEA